jgi:regulator of RNase E activity RraA
VADDVLNAFAALPTAVIGDAMSRLGALDATVHPVWPGAHLAGNALTVWVRAGDNLKIHEAIALGRVGDILVVNGQGSLAHALFGGLMSSAAARRGIRGAVVDGAVRDVDALARDGFPVFAKGVCASGPGKDETGEIGYPVAVGGVVCAAGDVVVGDSDGVIIVPRVAALAVLEQAALVAEWERAEAAELGGAALR